MISGRPRSVFFEGTKTRKMISNCRKSAEDEACAFDQSMCEVFVFVFAPFSVGSYMFCVFGTFFEDDFFYVYVNSFCRLLYGVFVVPD